MLLLTLALSYVLRNAQVRLLRVLCFVLFVLDLCLRFLPSNLRISVTPFWFWDSFNFL